MVTDMARSVPALAEALGGPSVSLVLAADGSGARPEAALLRPSPFTLGLLERWAARPARTRVRLSERDALRHAAFPHWEAPAVELFSMAPHSDRIGLNSAKFGANSADWSSTADTGPNLALLRPMVVPSAGGLEAIRWRSCDEPGAIQGDLRGELGTICGGARGDLEGDLCAIQGRFEVDSRLLLCRLGVSLSGRCSARCGVEVRPISGRCGVDAGSTPGPESATHTWCGRAPPPPL